MKRRRTLIISLLLVAALALGIGYANMSRVLNINGDGILNRDDSKFVVEFVDPSSITAGKGTVTASGTTANFDIENMTNAGEITEITLTVENTSEGAQNAIARLRSVVAGTYTLTDGNGQTITVPSNDPMFTITYEVINDQTQEVVWTQDGQVTGKTLDLAYGETATVNIKVQLNYALVTYAKVQLHDADISLYFDGVSAQNQNIAATTEGN